MSKYDPIWRQITQAQIAIESALDINVFKIEQGRGIDQGAKIRGKLEHALNELSRAKIAVMELDAEDRTPPPDPGRKETW